ncbi:hypothetical protein ACF0H5_012403 [Mactra antiquata]
MKLTRSHCSVLVLVLIGFCQLAQSASTTPAVSTNSTSTQTSTVGAAFTLPTNTGDNQSIRNFILQAVRDAVRESMLFIMDVFAPQLTTPSVPADTTPQAPTTTMDTSTSATDSSTVSSTSAAASNSTTASSSESSTASSTSTAASETTTTTGGITESSTSSGSTSTTTEAASTTSSGARQNTCPEGVYDSNLNTVTFTLEEGECRIIVYLGKAPKRSKGSRRSKQRGKSDKHVVFESLTDRCSSEVSSRKRGDTYMIYTPECMIVVTRNRGKGKNNDQPPTVVTAPL